jgi:hypothetical protein
VNAGLGPWSVPLSDIVTTQSHSVKPELVPLCGITELGVVPSSQTENAKQNGLLVFTVYTVRSSHRLLCPPPPPGSRNPSRRVPDTRHASCLALAYPGWVERIHGRRRCDLVTLLTAAFSLASPSRICRPSFSQDPFTGCHGWRYARTLTVSSGL